VHAPGEADLNLYAYVKGAVLKAVDPDGLQDQSIPCEGPCAPGVGIEQRADGSTTQVKGSPSGGVVPVGPVNAPPRGKSPPRYAPGPQTNPSPKNAPTRRPSLAPQRTPEQIRHDTIVLRWVKILVVAGVALLVAAGLMTSGDSEVDSPSRKDQRDTLEESDKNWDDGADPSILDKPVQKRKRKDRPAKEDDLQQQAELEEAQQNQRKRGNSDAIQGTGRSKQRARQQLKQQGQSDSPPDSQTDADPNEE